MAQVNCQRCDDTQQVTMCIDEHGMQDVFPCPDCTAPKEIAPHRKIALAYSSMILDGMKQHGWLTKSASSADRKDLHLWLMQTLLKFFQEIGQQSPKKRKIR